MVVEDPHLAHTTPATALMPPALCGVGCGPGVQRQPAETACRKAQRSPVPPGHVSVLPTSQREFQSSIAYCLPYMKEKGTP